MVADTGGDGFGTTLMPGGVNVFDFVGDGNDQIIFRGDTSIFGAGTVSVAASGLNFGDHDANFGPGVALGLFWIDGRSLANMNLSGGEPFGFYTDPTGIDTSAQWIAPADGATITLRFLTLGAIFFGPGTNPINFGITDMTVIPEPSTYLLMALGGVALLFYGRRRR